MILGMNLIPLLSQFKNQSKKKILLQLCQIGKININNQNQYNKSNNKKRSFNYNLNLYMNSKNNFCNNFQQTRINN